MKNIINEKVMVMDKMSYSHDDIDYFGTEEFDYLESSSPIYKHYYTTSSNKKMYICLESFRQRLYQSVTRQSNGA